MGIFSWSPRNSRRNFNAAHFPSHEDLVHHNPASLPSHEVVDKHEISPSKRKLRASVRCINFVQLLEERMAARRKFRAAVDVVALSNSFAQRVAARRKFRAAVQIIILSDRLVNRPLHQRFDLEAFQDAVNLVMSANCLEGRGRSTRTTTSTSHHQDKATLHEMVFRHLDLAVDKVLHGEQPRQSTTPNNSRHDNATLEKGLRDLNLAVDKVLHGEQPRQSTTPNNSRHDNATLEMGLCHLNLAVDKVLHGEQPRSTPPKNVDELHGRLVHKSQDFTKMWKFVEEKEASQDPQSSLGADHVTRAHRDPRVQSSCE